jgi:anti-sigma regulatory factor (Ser/Thr protein kinase)
VHIASGGRSIAGLGGSVARVGAPIVFVVFAGRRHEVQKGRARCAGRQTPTRDAGLPGGAAGHPPDVAFASWSIPALADEVIGIRREAIRFARSHGVPEDRAAEMRLAISEAVSNAVIHAFRIQDLPGTVTVSIDITAEQFAEVVVRDDGIGMTQRSDSPGLGLGLSIIDRLADETERRRPTDGVGFELWMRFRFGSE